MSQQEKEIEHSQQESRFKRIVGFATRYLLPLTLTVLLLWYIFRKVNFHEVIDILRHGVDYGWIIFGLGVGILAHVCRASRWQIQLKNLDIHPPFMATLCSIFGMYSLNLVVPRLGEIWRCSYISKRGKAPFSTVLGTMIADRMMDPVVVIILMAFTCVVAYSAIKSFFEAYPVGAGFIHLVSAWWFWVSVIVFCISIYMFFRLFPELAIVKKIREFISNIWHGFIAVGRIKEIWSFILLTAGIWICYYFQLYICFYAFDFTAALCHDPGLGFGLEPCLVAFVLSSIGMAVPSNGGLGPWNIAVIFGLAIYGIGEAEGTAFSILVWTAQNLMNILLGIFTMIYISIGKKQQKLTVESSSINTTNA